MLNAEPKRISVLTTVYDAYRWLGESVRSTLDQELPDGWNLELLIAIDGCPDALPVAREAAASDPRAGIVVLEKNVGPYVACNTLLRHVRGGLITRFDADDVMLPGRLRKVITKMETKGWAAGGCRSRPSTNPGISEPPSMGSWIFRRAVCVRLGGWQPWPCAADREYLNRFWHLGLPWGVVDEVLMERRIHQNQLTRRSNLGMRSVARERCHRRIREYNEEYRRGTRSLLVEPEVGCVASIEGRLFERPDR
jgi:glycosyltransferase involved in cell wall biosynthesis